MGRAWSEGIRHRRCRAALVHHRSETAGRFARATRLPTRWCHLPGKRAGPPSRRPVLSTTPAVALSGSPHLRPLDRGRRPVRDAGCWRPVAQPRQADQSAIGPPTANRSATSYCQPVCNEPASSSPPTANRSATSHSFHCHGACNVTRGLSGDHEPDRAAERRSLLATPNYYRCGDPRWHDYEPSYVSCFANHERAKQIRTELDAWWSAHQDIAPAEARLVRVLAAQVREEAVGT